MDKPKFYHENRVVAVSVISGLFTGALTAGAIGALGGICFGFIVGFFAVCF
jgi:hypothetical protein